MISRKHQFLVWIFMINQPDSAGRMICSWDYLTSTESLLGPPRNCFVNSLFTKIIIFLIRAKPCDNWLFKKLLRPDLEFVKKFTRPNFRVKEFYTLKTRQSRLFSPVINSKNASLSVIWPSFGSNWTKCVNSLIVMKKYYIEVCVNLQNM